MAAEVKNARTSLQQLSHVVSPLALLHSVSYGSPSLHVGEHKWLSYL